jgi:predicted transcriptional regulator
VEDKDLSTAQFNKLLVKEVMQKSLEINENSTIEIVSAQLAASPSEMVEIVNDKGELTGTATKTSVMKGLLQGASKSDEIKKAMYNNPLNIHEDKTVEEAIQTLNENQVDKLPVVDKDGKLVGTISRKDLLSKAGSFLKFKL